MADFFSMSAISQERQFELVNDKSDNYDVPLSSFWFS